jgi:hypothetical protein
MWHHLLHLLIYSIIAAFTLYHIASEDIVKAALYGGLAFSALVQCLLDALRHRRKKSVGTETSESN